MIVPTLRELLDRDGRKRADIAASAHIDRRCLALLEAGRSHPRPATLTLLTVALRCKDQRRVYRAWRLGRMMHLSESGESFSAADVRAGIADALQRCDDPRQAEEALDAAEKRQMASNAGDL